MSSSPILECYFWTVKYFIRQFRSPFSSFSCHGKSNQSNILSERHGFLWSHFYCCCFAVYSRGTLFLWQTFLLSCFFLPKNLFPFSVNHTSCSRLSKNQQLLAITTREKNWSLINILNFDTENFVKDVWLFESLPEWENSIWSCSSTDNPHWSSSPWCHWTEPETNKHMLHSLFHLKLYSQTWLWRMSAQTSVGLWVFQNGQK